MTARTTARVEEPERREVTILFPAIGVNGRIEVSFAENVPPFKGKELMQAHKALIKANLQRKKELYQEAQRKFKEAEEPEEESNG